MTEKYKVCKCGARRIDAQIGLEPTPEAYVAKMIAVFAEVRRVLRPDGTCWVNLGDSYSGNTKGTGGDGTKSGLRNDGRPELGRIKAAKQSIKNQTFSALTCDTGLKPKDLIGIPWRVALALQADGWYLRADIIWAKPNPMPESVTDRPTKSHEYVFLLTKQERYYFDQEAVREPTIPDKRDALWGQTKVTSRHSHEHDAEQGMMQTRTQAQGYVRMSNPAGRNLRSVWTIPTESYAGAHFATFPRKLVEPCIKAGTSERGACPTCGAPWERVTERETVQPVDYHGKNGDMAPNHSARRMLANTRARRLNGEPHDDPFPSPQTLGWRPTCSCHGHFETIEPDPTDTYARPTRVYIPDGPQPEPVPCVVLDPFAGSGTTLVVAEALGRIGIGLDLSIDYLAQARRRIERPHQPLTKQREQALPLFAHMEDA